MLDLIIKNGQCYIDGQLKEVNVAVKDGKIHEIGEISDEAKETKPEIITDAAVDLKHED